MPPHTPSWLSLAIGLLLLAGYEARLVWVARRTPLLAARSAHAHLRAIWAHAVSTYPGSEILAVQTLRNSVMSATITASTAILGLMGVTTLLMGPVLSGAESLQGGPRLAFVLLLMLALFASYLASAMSMRYYTHAGFVVSLPHASPERARLEPVGVNYLQRGGVLYGWGLRFFFYAAPMGVGIVKPLAMPFFCLALIAVLAVFDRPAPIEAHTGL